MALSGEVVLLWLLLIAHNLLLATSCSLVAVCCLLLTIRCLLLTTYYLLLTACYLLHDIPGAPSPSAPPGRRSASERPPCHKWESNPISRNHTNSSRRRAGSQRNADCGAAQMCTAVAAWVRIPLVSRRLPLGCTAPHPESVPHPERISVCRSE